MIGRAPMMPQGMPINFQGQTFATPPVGMQFMPPQGIQMQSAPPQNWQQNVARQDPIPPRRIVRAKVDEEPLPAPAPRRQAMVNMPAPEELGVAFANSAVPAKIDWAVVHQQLDRLGASCFHLERTPDGGCRITCLLATGQSGRNHRIEAEAASEADAVRVTLAKAEEWLKQR
jgi:hypothetical protein